MNRLTPVLLAALLLGAVSAAAESRWSLGLDVHSSLLGSVKEQSAIAIDTVAPGGSITVNYVLSPRILLRLYAGGAEHATDKDEVSLALGGGTLDLCYRFREGAAFRPYVFGGLGGYALVSQEDALEYNVEGVGAAVGFGAFHRLSRRFSLHAMARYEGMNWERVRALLTTGSGVEEEVTPVEESGQAGKFSFGVLYHF